MRVVHVALPGKDDARYLYIPFQVSSHTKRISINYSYDHANGANALDIGLFDSRSRESKRDLSGFRGWSGGRRAEFFIARDTATPGYIPGELPAGSWRIILGLYRVASGGVDVSFNISLETDENISTKLASAPPSQISSSLSVPAATGIPQATLPTPSKKVSILPRWIAGDLHLHTVHSDGEWTIAGLVTAARESGLDFICITDHNTMSHHAEIDRLPNTAHSLLAMRGEEITTYGGHANAWGLPANSLIDFRVRPGNRKEISAIVSEAHRLGALISINHPFAMCAGCAWSYDLEALDFDAIEVWNGSWDQTDERALALWDGLLKKGRHITAVASSDSHGPLGPIGQPTTHLAVSGELTRESVLNAIHAGRAYLTNEAARPVIRFSAQSPEDQSTLSFGERLVLTKPRPVRFTIATDALPQQATISLISQGAIVKRLSPKTLNAREYVDVDCESDCYFRLEIRDQTGLILALTNPIYVEMKNRR